MDTSKEFLQLTNESILVEQKQEIKEKIKIDDTTTFKEAIRRGYLEEAAIWFEKVKSKPKYNSIWLDH